MTPTDKQKCIAEQAVYGDLKLQHLDQIITTKGYDTALKVYGVLYWNNEDKKEVCFERDCTPILRPLSDLTEEITHKGYNDDKPFVPLFESVKNNFYGQIELIARDECTIKVMCVCKEKHIHERNRFEVLRKMTRETSDLLHLWHFDTRNLIDKDEAIDVNTLSANPYEVK